MSIGPPTTSITAVTETPMVAAYETPDAFKMNAIASDTPMVTATKPRIATTPPGTSRSLRGWALRTARNTAHEHRGANPDDETLPAVDGRRERDHQDRDDPPVPVGNDGQPNDLLLPLV